MFKLNNISILAIITIAVLLGFIFYNTFIETSISSSSYSLDNAYQESISYLNKTSLHIQYKNPSYDVDPADLLKLHKYIEEEKVRILNTPGISYKELTTVDTYGNITIVSRKLFNITMDLPIIWAGMEKSIDELSNLNIRKSLNIYYEMKSRLYNIVNELNESLKILIYVREKGILLDDHNTTVNYSIMVINDTLNTILEYIKLMEILSSNIENMENNNTNQTLLKLAESIAKQVDMEKLKPFAKQISMFLTKLSMGEIVKKQKTNMTNTENPGGISGGYSGSMEDD
ncbi:hypothetical protein [Staphylothermus hellenicus]|uniref:Uncharacterized protein n=1 Tax=Staphylothermus hellenicus (strain DSM 12710 / JCM 10830 / BK20S6-10-b1 / P8) TaxID=591019 RepID=D7D9A6_STAHD|nr:hypothetical protein [Staphylothermus hellenicus]ADI32352.1 hypothetical protein Shell_1254 [Staphylothermus hellenicus DSM 12710]